MITVFYKLLFLTGGVWGALIGIGRPEESLVGRGRHKKLSDPSSVHFQPIDVKKTNFGSSTTKVSTDKVEAELLITPPPPSQMIVELRIPTTLQEIQEGHVGPLSSFLDTVHRELCKAGKLSDRRLQLLGIRGEYTRVPANQSKALSLTRNEGKEASNSTFWNHNDVMEMADQYVIVELEVLPGKEHSEPSAESIEAEWESQMKTVGSPLLHGPLGALLKGASIQRPPVSMSSRLLLKNAFKSSAVKAVSFHSTSWALSIFLSLLRPLL